MNTGQHVCTGRKAPLAPYSAAIAAGGRSSRFGQDKALAKLGEHTLLERVAHSLSDAPVRLLVAPEGKYKLTGTLANWSLCREQMPDQGPLMALAAALEAAPYGWLAFAGVDQPMLTRDYWQQLWQGGWQLMAHSSDTSECSSIQALHDERPQPLAAFYHSRLLLHIWAQLAAGERRLRQAVPPKQLVQVLHMPAGFFANVNTPQDLQNLTEGQGQ